MRQTSYIGINKVNKQINEKTPKRSKKKGSGQTSYIGINKVNKQIKEKHPREGKRKDLSPNTFLWSGNQVLRNW